MSTTIAVLSLACIIVIFMVIKKIFKNTAVSIPEEEENDNVTPYKPPVELKINNEVLYSARSLKSNHSTRSPNKIKKAQSLSVAKLYESDRFVATLNLNNSDHGSLSSDEFGKKSKNKN